MCICVCNTHLWLLASAGWVGESREGRMSYSSLTCTPFEKGCTHRRGREVRETQRNSREGRRHRHGNSLKRMRKQRLKITPRALSGSKVTFSCNVCVVSWPWPLIYLSHQNVRLSEHCAKAEEANSEVKLCPWEWDGQTNMKTKWRAYGSGTKTGPDHCLYIVLHKHKYLIFL